jgi:hypothetical protein
MVKEKAGSEGNLKKKLHGSESISMRASHSKRIVETKLARVLGRGKTFSGVILHVVPHQVLPT